MLFREPIVEFVKIESYDIVTASGSGSGEDCIGCDAYSNNCGKHSMFMIDWDHPVDKSSGSHLSF